MPLRRLSLHCRSIRLALALFLAITAASTAHAQPAASGTFILHKFAKPIGKETYATEIKDGQYTLASHFLFTDRGSAVPLETTFTGRTADMAPVAYAAKGKSSRLSEMDDTITLANATLQITRSGKSQNVTPTGPWFITDGYSPVAMQEQMMRWWLTHNQPAEFTVYPAGTKVRIVPADTLTIDHHPAHGYTIAGLIWGQESLWLDDAHNLLALVSTDAEFDHFEAVREPYESSLSTFIAAAVKSNLAALARLSATARVPAAHSLAIVGATLEDSTGAPATPNSVILIEDGVIRYAGPPSGAHIPNDATILNAAGKFAIPGLWDMHAHYEQVEWGPIYLAAGITSVRDVGNEFDFIRTVHDELDRKDNPAVGPHLEFAGIIDGTGPISLGAITADTPDEAAARVAMYKAAGARQIKIYSSVKPEIVKAICADAHAQGLTVTGHIPEGMNAIEGVTDGMDQINHISYEIPYFSTRPKLPNGKPDRTEPPTPDFDSARSKELIDTLKQHRTVLDPTVALYETSTLNPSTNSSPASTTSPRSSARRSTARPPPATTRQSRPQTGRSSSAPCAGCTPRASPSSRAPTRPSPATRSIARSRSTTRQASHRSNPCRPRRFSQPALSASKKNPAHSNPASEATSCSSMQIHSPTSTTPAGSGAPLRPEPSTTPHRSGAP